MSIRLKPVFTCIYCGSNGNNLSDEHIMPFGLNGDRILPKASCANCSKVTCKIENACLRQYFGNIRNKLRMKTRNKKQRSNFITAYKNENNGSQSEIILPIDDYPAVFFLPRLKPAFSAQRYIEFRDPSAFRTGFVYYGPPHDKFAEILQSHGATTVDIGKFNIDIFSRMLAKIAHGYCVAEFGYDNVKSYVLDFIINDHGHFSNWVGGQINEFGEIENQSANINHIHNKNTKEIIVFIQFFSHFGSLTYHVCAGKTIR